MSYLLLIIEPLGQREARGPEAGREAYASMLAFGDSLAQRGVLQGAQSLAGLDDAARVQVRAGRPSIMDGPFAEAKEMVGGFFLIDVPSRDEALAIAAACPAAQWATVEVRELAPCYA